MKNLSAPTLISADHKLDNFNCGEPSLDEWLKISIAQDVGVFAILIHSLSEQAKRCYISRGFIESPLESMTLFMTLETIRSILVETD